MDLDFSSKKIFKSVWSIFLLIGFVMFIDAYNKAPDAIKKKSEYYAMYVFAIFGLIGVIIGMLGIFSSKELPRMLKWVRTLCLALSIIFVFMLIGYGTAVINDMGAEKFRSIFALTLIGYVGIAANETCNFDPSQIVFPSSLQMLLKSPFAGRYNAM